MIKDQVREELPPLVKHLIINLGDKSQNIYQRQNYKDRLQAISSEIDKALLAYSKEVSENRGR